MSKGIFTEGEKWSDAIRSLDGVAVVNINEPSEGDLERIADAYAREIELTRKLTKENERLVFDLQDTKSSLKNYKEMVGYNFQVIERYRAALDDCANLAYGVATGALDCQTIYEIAQAALTPQAEGEK